MGMNFFQKIALPLRLQESPFAVFNTWRYDPTAGEKRDFRLDFLRGIAIIFMVVNHLESHSYFNNITQGHIYASAAEGFVFLSGYVLGMVTLKRIDREGLKSAMRKLLERSRVLYFTSFTLMVSLGLISIIAPGMTRPSFEQAPGSWWQIILAAATFHHLLSRSFERLSISSYDRHFYSFPSQRQRTGFAQSLAGCTN
jgi:peptidoglycan/LPS O-acetylase OafA/YrhL